MKNKLIAGVFLATLAFAPSFASGAHHLGEQSLHVARNLQSLAQSNEGDLCSGDVLVAAAYMQSAGYALTRDKIQSARESLVYAQNELKEISHNRSYCTLLAPKVKPYLAEAILIQGALDAENLKQGLNKAST